MRSLKYIAVSLSLLCAGRALACISPTYTPGEYYVFRVYERDPHAERASWEPNVQEWRRYTRDAATAGDIYNLVYRYPVEALERLGDVLVGDSLRRNSFAAWLMRNNDREAIRYLILAKKCENLRMRRNDPWWYPTKQDLEYEDMKGIVGQALAYKGSRFKARYMLQAIRAGFTMYDFDLCLELWEKQIKDLPNSVAKAMCADYIGGVYFRRGDYRKAILLYAQATEVSDSFWWCARQLTKTNSDMERIKTLYRYNPSASELGEMVQKICREAEEYANNHIFNGEDPQGRSGSMQGYRENRGRYMALRDFALEAASENRGENPAMWPYAASFLTLIDGDAPLASQYLAQAEKMRATPLTRNSIKIMRIMLDAMTGDYTAAFEKKILPQMEWLDGMMRDNLTAELKQEVRDWERTFCNYSFYYYGDMMRKITLSVMVPRYLKEGRSDKALLLAGMASERLRQLASYRGREKGNEAWENWNEDFCTDIFELMDTLPVQSVIGYARTLQNGGDTPFDRFCVKKCYNDPDYFNEIIGTKYMRAEQFDNAVEYLSKVRPGYDTTLNVYAYYTYDPFADPFITRKKVHTRTQYKLGYALRMADLARLIQAAQSREMQAGLTYQYALGLTRAARDCWALMEYGRWGYTEESDHNKRLARTSEKLLRRVCSLSADPELKARCAALRMWVSGDDLTDYKWTGGRWEKSKNPKSIYRANAYALMTEYSSTETCKRMLRECDLFHSYIETEKPPVKK